MLTLDELRTWLTRQDGGSYSVAARLNRGDRTHTGHLSFQGDKIHVRDSRRAPRRGQYATIFDRHLEAGQLEIKVDGRYRPAADAVADWKAAWL